MKKKNNFSTTTLKGEVKWLKEWDKYFVGYGLKDEPLWVKVQRDGREKSIEWENNKKKYDTTINRKRN